MGRKVMFTDDVWKEVKEIACQSNRYAAGSMLARVPEHDLDELRPKPPAVNPDRVIGLRWFSIMNPWMDCLVLTQERYREDAAEAIETGIDEFWEESSLCYGDCIELSLAKKNIPFVIEYEDEHVYSSDEKWEEHLEQYATIGIKISNV